MTFKTVRLTGADLSGARLAHLRIADSALSGCDLANLQGRGLNVDRATLEDCRLTGVMLLEGILSDVTIRGSRVDLACSACAASSA
ncbi:pentapeptide repeat-containing protein [Solirubrobacter ginsenosidimutans]|uniref:Pentapeptide repeat-containing protein n=1 Tax=Solirubrobacter ginsenosidimutans TaxID=490573 RepID=A0A9X3MRZ9_9ACTN|nr:pentapeptide repeat-containing protein [Solirubrobacter ginsenosidimutans]MDA0161307.1 pentapeptide repeat-containing protein [Solirubrobacter ginsenosidimutans]